MSAIAACSGCAMGQHEHHVYTVVPAPRGGVGGAVCTCQGNCQPPDLSSLFGEMPTGSPTDSRRGS